MAATLDRIRLSATAFDDAQQLWGMIGALIARGIDATQLCIVATASAMVMIRRFGPARLSKGRASVGGLDARLADLSGDVEPCCELSSGEPVLASSGPVLDLLLCGRGRMGAAGRSLIDDISLAPDRALHQGAPTLVVLSHEASQQRIATQTLLRHSQHRVRTFELTPPPRSPTQATGADYSGSERA
jgi:hypothetical protein